MRELPILFSGPMVRAILDGKKTQTRRALKGSKHHDYDFSRGWVDPSGMCRVPVLKVPYKHKDDQWEQEKDDDTITRIWPKYQVGDRLWVRETWQAFYAGTNRIASSDHIKPHIAALWTVAYKADDTSGCECWRPSIHMPRWASRITLEVTGVRVERLQDISIQDSIAEGIRCPLCGYTDRDVAEQMDHYICSAKGGDRTAIDEYRDIWDSINGKTYPWNSNPWVWIYEFKKEPTP